MAKKNRGKANKNYVSIVIDGDYPEMWVPEFLRAPLRLKRFWYIRLKDLVVAIWRVLTKPFRGKPALEITPEVGVK